jgi:protease I
MANLEGKRIAILVTDGFEQVELTEPKKALEAEGAHTAIIAPKGGDVKAWKDSGWGDNFPVDSTLGTINAADYDALLLPGGVMNPDKLRMEPNAIAFIQAFAEAGKPIAAICHGPWTLIEAGIVEGRTLTSYPSLKTDIQNAGGHWVDEEVVTDNGLVTSRKPDDLPAFNRKFIEEIREGIHHRQKTSHQPTDNEHRMSSPHNGNGHEKMPSGTSVPSVPMEEKPVLAGSTPRA